MRRPTIHRSTLVVALGMLAIVILLNVPGDNVAPLSHPTPTDYRAEYLHGWPWISLYRSANYELFAPKPFPDMPRYGIPWLSWSSWECWQGDHWKLRPGALLGDFLAGLLLIVLVAAAWEWRRRQRTRWLQFTLREIAVATVMVAAAFGWWRYELAQHERENHIFEDAWTAMRPGGFGYHGPTWLKRLVGDQLLWPAFIRNDGVCVEVVEDTQFQDALPVLRGFPYLHELELENNAEDEGTQILFSDLAAFKGLRRLTLSHFNITKSDVEELAALRQLDEICLSNWASIDPDEIQRLMDALPRCRIVEVSGEYEYIEGYGWRSDLGLP